MPTSNGTIQESRPVAIAIGDTHIAVEPSGDYTINSHHYKMLDSIGLRRMRSDAALRLTQDEAVRLAEFILSHTKR
jgi:hypothetical protein